MVPQVDSARASDLHFAARVALTKNHTQPPCYKVEHKLRTFTPVAAAKQECRTR